MYYLRTTSTAMNRHLSIITGVTPGDETRPTAKAVGIDELQQQIGRAGKQCPEVTPPAGARTAGSMHEV